ncbi:hypothetical protein [Luteimonas terricola]|uniref:Uncharacterized protein n=1 Tax=Luteimonas terricola TaxID=645597 RepID=A0ABQ2EID1_9GAMM|nr:hypothetical protein [Luteimonas terricola]GGK12551.1 hypothetical protein GCM10011394_22240 [Luteimonas terricola]
MAGLESVAGLGAHADADAEAAEAGAHGDARLVAEQVLEVADDQFVHALTIDDADGIGHVDNHALGAGGGDRDAVELDGARSGRGGGQRGVGGAAGRPQPTLTW